MKEWKKCMEEKLRPTEIGFYYCAYTFESGEEI